MTQKTSELVSRQTGLPVTSGSIRSRVKLNVELEFQGPGEEKVKGHQVKNQKPKQIHPREKPRNKFLSGGHKTAARLIENSEKKEEEGRRRGKQ